MTNEHEIILRPIITESSMSMGEQKKYVFAVKRTATKPQITEAVEKLFGVDVKSVNTISMKRKPKKVRYQAGYTSAWKKAVVTLRPDSKTIEFFDGMI